MMLGFFSVRYVLCFVCPMVAVAAMDLLLAGLRERKLQIPLKAVITPHNIQWTSRMLYQELKKEHETMTAMKKSPL